MSTDDGSATVARRRAGVARLVVDLAVFYLVMLALVPAVGFGIGAPELVAWLLLLALGTFLLGQRHWRSSGRSAA